ncbi:MAG: hypothetical protein RLZZ157_2 [Pseudomonadota bacterium]|jgi:hypothetical protein
MRENLDIKIEVLSPKALTKFDTGGSELFWIHLDSILDVRMLSDWVADAHLSPNLVCIFISGQLSEMVHDAFDDVLEAKGEVYQSVLTVWSKDNLADATWEFLNIYGIRSDIISAKVLIVAKTNVEKMTILGDLSRVALDLDS